MDEGMNERKGDWANKKTNDRIKEWIIRSKTGWMKEWINIFTCRTGRAEELEGSNSPENNIFSAVPKPVIWTNKLINKLKLEKILLMTVRKGGFKWPSM